MTDLPRGVHELIDLREACKLDCFRDRSGRSPHLNTVRRWLLKGQDGVFLGAECRGRSVQTTVNLCMKFKQDLLEAKRRRHGAAAARRKAERTPKPRLRKPTPEQALRQARAAAALDA